MDESITLSFDEKSPRVSDDILLDLSTVREYEKNVDIGDGLILSKPESDGLEIVNGEFEVEIKDEQVSELRNDEVPYMIDESEMNGIEASEPNLESAQTKTSESENENPADDMNNKLIHTGSNGSADVAEYPINEDRMTSTVQNDERQSVEFSDVLASQNEDVSNGDGFTSVMNEVVEDKMNNDKEPEFEGEADIDLENIKVQEKEQESDSGSEFDFELPTTKSKQSEVITDKPKPEVYPNITEDEIKKKEPNEDLEPSNNNVQSHVPSSNEDRIKNTEEVEHVQVDSKSERVLEAAKNEWDNVTTIQAGYMEGQSQGAEPTIVETLTPMSPYEMTQIIKQEDFTNVKSDIRTSVERKGFAAFVNFLFGPPKLKRQLLQDRERIFCVAATQLNNDSPSHLRTLQTIYRSLTGSKFDCRRFGSHWEEIGFQGSDPSTDLRSVGMLGLVNLLFFLKTPKTQALASDIYRLSLHPTQNFPFCVMGINMTRITIQCFREDLLNKECNKRGEVLEVVTEFYVGLYLLLYQIWKGQGKTVSDSGFVIKDIEMKARKSTNDIFKNLEDYFTKKKTVITDVSPGIETENLQFVNVCDDK